MRVWICLALLVGCGKPDCAHAISGAVARMVEDAHRHKPAAAYAVAVRIQGDMKRVLTSACVDDHWADEVIACVDHAATQSELDACNKLLTKDQRDREAKRMDEVLKAAMMPVVPTGDRARP